MIRENHFCSYANSIKQANSALQVLRAKGFDKSLLEPFEKLVGSSLYTLDSSVGAKSPGTLTEFIFDENSEVTLDSVLSELFTKAP